ncbi:SSI family serine proteinase inhibitor [Streptomyces cavernae]|uniref:SSI family serine proteinase inhibitor n=1 Tax=Streptomyces cavernae TaxID=2259034 RepID=UPI000FEBEA5E|nr:SSI family serine proteinase inhibitor [Streptomyces cavernae]
MTKTIRTALLAAAVALLATGAAPAPAAPAAPATASPVHVAAAPAAPGNWLYVTVAQGESRPRFPRGTLLMCDRPQRHKRAVEACAQLRRARGDINRIPHRKVMCPMIYAPVTASARGLWNGRTVGYEKRFGSRCELEAQTGSVFTLRR